MKNVEAAALTRAPQLPILTLSVQTIDSHGPFPYNVSMISACLRRGWLASFLLLACLTLWPPFPAPAAEPPRPQLLEPGQAPRIAKILSQVQLSYAPAMSPQERDRDFLQKITLAKSLLKLTRLVDLRYQTVALLNQRDEPSWESLRLQRWPSGERVGLTLSVPVWVPARAQKIKTFVGFEKHWQTVALQQPRPSGFVWFAPRLSDINDKAGYRPERITLEVNSRFAPLAALFLEYLFREGWYEPGKRVPLLVVRAGEDTYASEARSQAVTAECLSFSDDEGASLAAQVVMCQFPSLAAIYHGRHSKTSNHRLGLALDLNDFNFDGNGLIDGPPNPISRALRQYDRNAMHRLDARHLPAWVYRCAKWVGFRLPQEWNYFGYHTDWPHFDVGTK